MKSPCVKQCNITEDSKYCKGCKRTVNEIMNWTKFTDEQRLNIIRILKHRNIYKDIHDDNNDYIRN